MAFLKKVIAILTITGILCVSFFLFWVSTHRVAPILTYHSINSTQKSELFRLSPKAFERVIQFIDSRGYKVIPLSELVQATSLGRKIPKKTIAITFDDGYEDNYTNAFPILKKYKVPATIFIPVKNMGKKGFLSIEQMKEMMESGLITFGSHSYSHAYLPQQSEKELIKEIVGSKNFMKKALGVDINFIAYPSGGFNEKVKQVAKDAGYLAGFTTNRGYDRYNRDLFELKRTAMRQRDVEQWMFMWIKLSGYYNVLRKAKKPY